MTDHGAPMLRMQGVVAGYGGGDVLQGVDITVPTGSVACIVGPNGAGKSTVLKTVSGLLTPRLGEVHLRGKRIDQDSAASILAQGISQVPQSNALFPSMSVRENVLLGAYIIRRDKPLVKQRYDEVAAHITIVGPPAAPSGNIGATASERGVTTGVWGPVLLAPRTTI